MGEFDMTSPDVIPSYKGTGFLTHISSLIKSSEKPLYNQMIVNWLYTFYTHHRISRICDSCCIPIHLQIFEMILRVEIYE